MKSIIVPYVDYWAVEKSSKSLIIKSIRHAAYAMKNIEVNIHHHYRQY